MKYYYFCELKKKDNVKCFCRKHDSIDLPFAEDSANRDKILIYEREN